ncbi:hypothetical protein EC957_000587 [Mortierella hygrophila]|uniref:VPS9 domain-containing protein n=1 Tax=Mortierella hygrophila TaxID=979708 RepID=A0A9P6F6K9_9FUNG|nr:hypothetical protein EC957_000587 [Mortierella hygrophila]
MSSREGDDERDTLSRSLQNTSLSENNSPSSVSVGQANNNTKSPQPTEANPTPQEDSAVTTTSPQGSTGNITFADIPTAAGHTEDDSSEPTLTRRRSSMSTLGRRLSRIASTEKHVTIIDEPSADTDNATQPKETDTPEDKGKEEESKMELAKILMQFDPLVEAKAVEDSANDEEAVTETVLSREIPEASLSPDISLSSASSPSTPQQMDSPRTTHDVEVVMAERARSSSTSSSKKKSEPRQKSTLSSETATSNNNDRGTVGSNSSRSEPPKPKDIPFDFHKFLEQMRHRSATPITRYFQSFLKEFDKKPWTVNEQIKIIHDFLEFITGKMEMCELWRNVSDQEFENVKEGMEKLVMNRLFTYTFSPSTTDDAERDEVLTQKIQIFRWIKPEHLDIPDNAHNAAYLDKAQAELKKINSYKAPRDKVICILNCCKFIFTLIRRSEGSSKGADTFLPILIYVVLQSNPPNLVSNVQYISRFRNPDKLQAEAGYYLASLDGAISFIENLEASSLSISPADFDSQIERTMNELSQEKANAAAAAEAAKSPASSVVPETGTQGHRKQDSKLATLLAGTAATRNSRSRPPINEKQYQSPMETTQFSEKTPSLLQHHSSRAGPESSSNLSYSRLSPMPSIRNPAAALIERGANFATKTIQKPLDIIEKMFQDNGDEEDMAKPYPPRPTQEQHQQQQQQFYNVATPPTLPQRPVHVPQGSQQQQRPANLERDDSFAEFVYVPAGQTVQEVSPQQPGGYYQQQQDEEYPGNVPRTRQRTFSGTQQQLQQPLPPQQQQQQQLSMEEYLQALETLTDMFPSCERQVCDVILQANEGRLSPSIDTLLEISFASDNSNNQGNNQTNNTESNNDTNTIEQPETNKDV